MALACYGALATLVFAQVWLTGDPRQRLGGGTGDPWGFVWFLAWVPHALHGGHSPLFSHALMAPGGANLLNSTSVLLLGLIASPVTVLFGPVLSYNMLITLAPALSALACFVGLRAFGRSSSAAWFGGLLYGFGSYVVGQQAAHLNLAFAVFPWVVAVILRRLWDGSSPRKAGILLGLAVTLQYFVSEEVVASTAVFGALVALVFCLAAHPPRQAVQRFSTGIGLAVVVFAVLGGGAVIYQLLGPGHVVRVLQPRSTYVTDVLSFVVPDKLHLLSNEWSTHLTDRLTGYDGEYGAYLGLPLLAVLTLAVVRLRRRALPAVAVVSGAALLSLGPFLHVNGRDTGFPLPWIVFDHVPLIDNVLPARLTMFMWAGLAMLVSLYLDVAGSGRTHMSRNLRYGLAGVALIPLVPALAVNIKPPAPVLADRRVPASTEVLVVPLLGTGQLAMYAQAAAHFRFRIPEGGVFVPAGYGAEPGLLIDTLKGIEAGSPSAAVGSRDPYLADLHRMGVSIVVVELTTYPQVAASDVAFFTSVLGPGEARNGTVTFDVPTAS